MKIQNLAQHHINNNLKNVQKDIEKIANPNATDIVNQFVNDVFQNEINTNLQEVNNYNDAIGVTQIASSALNSIQDNISNIDTLKVASNNAALNSNNLSAINSQIQKYTQNINDTLNNTTFNNKNVFREFQFNDITLNTSMPKKFDVDNIDEFKKSLNSAFSSVGAATNGLTDKVDTLSKNIVAKTAAQKEEDIVKKASQIQNEKLKLNASILAQAHQNSLNIAQVASLLRD